MIDLHKRRARARSRISANVVDIEIPNTYDENAYSPIKTASLSFARVPSVPRCGDEKKARPQDCDTAFVLARSIRC